MGIVCEHKVAASFAHLASIHAVIGSIVPKLSRSSESVIPEPQPYNNYIWLGGMQDVPTVTISTIAT